MNLWLDDIRKKPDGFDLHVTNVRSAKELIITGRVKFISFDHDLGDNQDTGYDLAKFIEELAANNMIPRLGWSIHSANPVGAEKIRQAMKSADRFWNNKSNDKSS